MFPLYFYLLKEWCDALLKLQVNEIKTGGLFGGILCPACSRIHGRCADAVYPLMHMAHATGDRRYLDAALKLQAWSDHVSCPDGSWVNEPEKLWKGITVFGALSLAGAIRHHGMILEKNVCDRWTNRLRKAADFIMDTFTMETGNINYPITASAALTAAGLVLDNQAYLKRGREFARESLRYFTKNRLIFGEGRGLSPSGKPAVDLGYNVEESLPALVLYGRMAEDEEVLETAVASLLGHLEFMLPDGAWDNSWGTRNFKWTYYGSRTSDGCQTAYALLADRDERFAEAARRNTLLLKSCTHDGILYGGPHYYRKGEPPCIHHTFCKAKALAAVLDYTGRRPVEEKYTALPREAAQGVKEYPEIGTFLAAKGGWRATVTAYDYEYLKNGHAGGGSLSMLWHTNWGPVLAAGMTEYAMHESTNMQRERDNFAMSPTPRLELTQGGHTYRNISDFNAVLQYEQTADEIRFYSSGRLTDGGGQSPPEGEACYSIDYVFKDSCVVISVKGDFLSPASRLRYWLPVIADRSQAVDRMDSNSVRIRKGSHTLTVNASLPLMTQPCDNDRMFSLVPGFETIPFYLNLKGFNECNFMISVGR